MTEPPANSRALRELAARLPFLAFESDITDVVYANYLVEASKLEPLVPEGLELDRLGANGEHAIFTHLTYKHGHFGPRIAGPLRALFPSPIQSNWRIHVRDPKSGIRGIYFVTTAISSTPIALAARVMAEGVPMHVPRDAAVVREANGELSIRLDPGAGSAPDLLARLRPSAAPSSLPAPWNACFASWRTMLEYVVPQDRAMSTQPWCGRVTRQEIELGIAFDDCLPLEGEVESRAAAAIAGDARPLCFHVEHVCFLLQAELHDDYTRHRPRGPRR